MRPVRIPGFTRELAKSQPEFTNLCIRDELVEVDSGRFVNGMSSLWEPTPKQLALLNAGGKVRITILGLQHPPVALDVEPVDG